VKRKLETSFFAVIGESAEMNTANKRMMTGREHARLAELEIVLEQSDRGRGLALREIRDDRLYREAHATFEAYCQERWGIGRNYANKLIAFAKNAEGVGTAVPTNERQLRSLSGLTADDQYQAFRLATTNGSDPSSDEVREARDLLAGLSKEDKLLAIQQAEARAEELRNIPRKARTQGPLERIEILAGRCRLLHARLPIADEADAALNRYLKVVRSAAARRKVA
jgi:hypothetical protein